MTIAHECNDLRDEAEERAAVAREARRWEGTPFHWRAQIPGPQGGADCATFPCAVYQNVGLFTIPVHDMPEQWHLHRGREEYVETIAPFMRECTIGEIREGDFLMTRIGRLYSHGGIVVGWPLLVHCYGFGVHCVNVLTDAVWRGQENRYFSPWGKR